MSKKFNKYHELGFSGSTAMLKNACSVDGCDKVRGLQCLSTVNEAEIQTRIEERLGVVTPDISIRDYMNVQLYLKDAEVVGNVEQQCDVVDSNIDIVTYLSPFTESILKSCEVAYTDLFESCYQVLGIEGMLISDGLATLEDGEYKVKRASEYNSYSVLRQKIGYVEDDSDSFNPMLLAGNFLTKIVKVPAVFKNINKALENPKESSLTDNQVLSNLKTAYSNASKINDKYTKRYFYKKMLAYAKGYMYKDDKFIPSNKKTWEDFWSDVILEELNRASLQYLLDIIYGFELHIDNRYANTQFKDLVDTVMRSASKYFVHNVTGAVMLTDYVTASVSTYTYSLYKLRIKFTDIQNLVPLKASFTENVIEKTNRELGDSVPQAPVPVSHGKRGTYAVAYIEHKFNEKLSDAVPLFAYKALDSLIDKANSYDNPQEGLAEQLSWKNIILGIADDGTVFTSEQAEKFEGCYLHFIIAGSRSGKGVMTLNILATALAMGKPIFYIDNKPDMASMFRTEKLGGKQMFCVNGGYNATFDTFKTCEASQLSSSWYTHIPPELLKHFKCNDEKMAYSKFSILYYMRAIMFAYSVIYIRNNCQDNEDLFNILGGDNGIVVVIDEITRSLNTFESFLDTDAVNSILTNNKKEEYKKKIANEKTDFSKKDVPFVSYYMRDYINAFNECFDSFTSFKVAGFEGTESTMSDCFVIGQEMPPYNSDGFKKIGVNKTEGLLKPSGAPRVSAITNCLFDIEKDGFLGYNKTRQHYMDVTNPEMRSSTRLTEAASNFAYLDFNSHWDDITTKNTKVKGQLDTEAKYFKPFLILNDGDEKSRYVDVDLRNRINKNFKDKGKTFKKVLKMNSKDGKLRSDIGFIPYVERMSMGAINIQDTLKQSYDIANYIVKALGYSGDCIDFIYDLRPEWMFTFDSLTTAVKNYFQSGEGKNIRVDANTQYFRDDEGSGDDNEDKEGVDVPVDTTEADNIIERAKEQAGLGNKGINSELVSDATDNKDIDSSQIHSENFDENMSSNKDNINEDLQDFVKEVASTAEQNKELLELVNYINNEFIPTVHQIVPDASDTVITGGIKRILEKNGHNDVILDENSGLFQAVIKEV